MSGDRWPLTYATPDEVRAYWRRRELSLRGRLSATRWYVAAMRWAARLPTEADLAARRDS